MSDLTQRFGVENDWRGPLKDGLVRLFCNGMVVDVEEKELEFWLMEMDSEILATTAEEWESRMQPIEAAWSLRETLTASDLAFLRGIGVRVTLSSAEVSRLLEEKR